ncbi:hypothetical protein ACOSQ2_008059 [Xanthoceras sorbifolium]
MRVDIEENNDAGIFISPAIFELPAIVTTREEKSKSLCFFIIVVFFFLILFVGLVLVYLGREWVIGWAFYREFTLLTWICICHVESYVATVILKLQ